MVVLLSCAGIHPDPRGIQATALLVPTLVLVLSVEPSENEKPHSLRFEQPPCQRFKVTSMTQPLHGKWSRFA
jgi:hypothetical protein